MRGLLDLQQQQQQQQGPPLDGHQQGKAGSAGGPGQGCMPAAWQQELWACSRHSAGARVKGAAWALPV
jgi:hypothetical protein